MLRPALGAAATPECGESVTLAELIARPDAHHGKTVRVWAYVTIDFENMTACPSEDESRMSHCLWLVIDDGPHRTDADFARYQSKLRTWARYLSVVYPALQP